MYSNQKFLIVLDLDGTLLTSDKHISPKTKACLTRLSMEGHVVAMASGRPPRAIRPFYDELGLDAPMVGYNGAIIVNPHENKTLFEKRFPLSDIQRFLDQFPLSMFNNIEAEYGNEMFFLEKEHEYEDYFHVEGMDRHYGPFRDTLREDVNAFIIDVKEPDDRAKIDEAFVPGKDMGLRFWYDSEHIGEFCFYNVNKATAIQSLQKAYDIDRAHVIAFGDADNDVEMLGHAGISFAMKNGSEHLRKVATYVTPEDNDHDGIAAALERIFG